MMRVVTHVPEAHFTCQSLSRVLSNLSILMLISSLCVCTSGLWHGFILNAMILFEFVCLEINSWQLCICDFGSCRIRSILNIRLWCLVCVYCIIHWAHSVCKIFCDFFFKLFLCFRFKKLSHSCNQSKVR